MNKILLTVVSASLFTLVGCGTSTSSKSSKLNPDGTATDSFKIEKVGYTLDGSKLPKCTKPAKMTTTKTTNSEVGIHQCVWFCGEYEGARPVSVTLSFLQLGKNENWKFDGETVTTAPDQCHN